MVGIKVMKIGKQRECLVEREISQTRTGSRHKGSENRETNGVLGGEKYCGLEQGIGIKVMKKGKQRGCLVEM